ncbi:MAG: pyridoxamine 5'-phosphate oxidase, partial [Bacteroidetes bacterium]|nr:pyridoxamine 5'-phosphate oxidase [Bacteroidota bacterium]
MEKSKLENMRQNYMLKSLNNEDLADNPFEQFKTWLHEAVESQLSEPNAMTIATVNAEGKPS